MASMAPMAPMAQGISAGMTGGMPGQQVHQAKQQLSQHEKQQLVKSNHLANQWLDSQANQVKLQPGQVEHQGIHQQSLVQNGVTQLGQQSQSIAVAHGYQPTTQPRWSPAVAFAPPVAQPLHVFPSKDASRLDFELKRVEFGLTRILGV